ncbi:MAG: PIG-L family deacetylase [Cyclobacteriaceae bacterium]|nr:PIG-L family deacetylase [Cyclobacteriaceae bacterium]
MRWLALLLICLLTQCAPPEQQTSSTTPRTLLAIFAHPDDEATVSPVLAKYAAAGVTVYLAIATDGRYGVTDHAKIPAGDSLATVRREEAKCAAEKLGIQPPILFGLHDQLKMGEGMGPLNEQLNTMRTRIAELFTSLKPDVVITWGASGWTGHHDHRLVSTVVTEVFQTQKWNKPVQLYFSAIPTGNLPANSSMQLATVDSSFLSVKIPVSESDYEKALASWHCHKSQYTPQSIEGMHQLLKASLKSTAYFMPVAVSSIEKNSLF